jgi:hypothetical protein
MNHVGVSGEHWDVAVIGGGPAGMMAAASAAAKGARVVLLEKNARLGEKLLITGGGRCNVTNAEFDNRKLLAKFKHSGKFLFSPFSKWSVQDTLDFFHARGMPTKVEAEQRVFPVSNTAQSVWDVLIAYLEETGVTIRTKSIVTGLEAENGVVSAVQLKNGKTIRAQSFILATGGISHPETGSTGDGYTWLKSLGHTVNDTNAALVPIAVNEAWVRRAAGVTLRNAKITLFQNEVKQLSHVGKVLFTHVGLSGPGILNMSRDIGELLKYGEVIVEIDLMAESGYEKVNTALQDLFKTNTNKMIKNSLGGLIPPALVPVLLELSGIAGDTFCNSVTRDSRVRLMKQLKHLRLTVKGLLGLEKAIITSGGVALTDVDFQTMRSRLYSNLYLVGDILDIDRPSGGYSLQLCWTSGHVAGEAASS